MKRITAVLMFCVIMVSLLIIPAEAYDMGKAGEHQTVSMGNTHTAAIKPDGSLWVWGRNYEGQVGNGGRMDTVSGDGLSYQSAPVKVLDNVVSVSCGGYHTAAVLADGSLWAWGSNSYGQIGNGGNGNASDNYGKPVQTTPVKVLDNVAAVSCGNECTAAVKTDGSLWIWGNLYHPSATPVKVMNNVTAVSCSDRFFSVIKRDGTLWVWGTFYKKEYAGYSGIYYNYTNPIKLDSNVADISCDGSGLAYIKNDGTVWTWISNSYGQRGDGTIVSYPPIAVDLSPTQVSGLSNAVSISCGKGYTHVAVVLADGSLWMWGSNFEGQLGNGLTGNAQHDNVSSYRPIQTTPVKIMDQVASVFCGSDNTAVIKNDGTFWTWGDNSWEKLGYQGGDKHSITSTPSSNVTWGVQTTPKEVTGFTVKPSGGAIPTQPTVPTAPTVAGFTDVKTTDYYAEAVKWAVETRITEGTTSTTFSPNEKCTVAQILTFLWRANGSPEPTISNPYVNVVGTEYYAKAVIWAWERGLLNGRGFSDRPCTRAQAVTYQWILAGSPYAAPTTFRDVPANAPYATAVAWALSRGITSGTSSTTFSPGEVCTRGQIVTFLHRDLV